MKKLVLILAVLILAAGICFAQEDDYEETVSNEKQKIDRINLEVSIGVPVHWTTSKVTHNFYDDPPDMDRTVTSSTSIGLALNFNFSSKFGFLIDFDVFVGSDVMGHTGTNSFSSSLFGINALAGPVIYLYNSSFLRVPLALGLHVYYWSSDHWDFLLDNENWINTKDFQMGPGLYLGIQFHFNDRVYMFSRTNVAVDLFRSHKVRAFDGTDELNKSHSGFEVGWMVKPTLGVGVKF